MSIYVLGILYTTHAASRTCCAKGSGDVVFVSRLAGRLVPRADGTVYAATTHAVTAIADGLRIDVSGKGIRALDLEPGLVRADFPRARIPAQRNTTRRRSTPPSRPGTFQRPCSTPSRSRRAKNVEELLIRTTEQPK